MKLKKLFLLCSALLMVLLLNTNSFAQTVSKNLNNIRVDELSDSQVRQFMTQLQSGGLSVSQYEQVALSRGMKAEELRKLRDRVSRIEQNDQRKLRLNDNVEFSQNSDTTNANSDNSLVAEKAFEELRSKIFGADLFSGKTSTFEPNLRLATPLNYQVGPDDELLIDIYGYSEASYNLKVSADGTVNIPLLGVVPVGGMTIEQATSRIRSRLSSIYSGIQTDKTNVRVAIGNIRSIKVVLTGELVKPGTYTLPSVASVFNALYESGGPTQSGSFRQIEVIRGGQRVATIDIYDFLLKGELNNNLRLQDNDVIRVPTYLKRVEIVGEVKHPGIFEMLNDEKVSDLLRFAGDFTERAYQARIKVLKNTDTERKVSDIIFDEFKAYEPSGGDKFFIDEILDRFENRVTIEGAVFRPGQYELQKGLTLSQLIRKAEGLREDAFLNRGYIVRLKNNLQTELISFDFSAISSGNLADIPLQREDVISISSIFDLKEEYFVQIEGEVIQPGKFNYSEGMTLEDVILQAGGFKEGGSPERIEVSRRVKNSDLLSMSAQSAEILQFDINKDLKSKTFGLQPFDIISVRQSSGYEVQRQVKIEGEVLYPGIYSISSKDERISDLVKRAGGFTAQAFIEGASLKRSGVFLENLPQSNKSDINSLNTQTFQEDIEILDGMTKSVSDSISFNPENDLSTKNEFVGINLQKIIAFPKSNFDIFLEEGDVLNIPKQLQTVKVSGQVNFPSSVIYSKGKGFKSYIGNSGGFSQLSGKKRSYVKYANGSIKATKKFIVFNFYPTIKPGSEIVVTQGPTKRPFRVQEFVGVGTSLLTLYLLLNQVN
jgi:protein involved in polysaccharide export with SLBB domain